MKATILTKFGGTEVLEWGDTDAPSWRADQMLVRVAACGVCGHDLINRQGHFPDTHLPCVLGHEIAGVVEAVGPLVTAFGPGDRVALGQRIPCGICPVCQAGRENLCRKGPGFYGVEISGGYGEFVLASERNAVHLPDDIGLDAGAILSCAIATGYHALSRARLQQGDTVVITAASGGVGFHTVELAKILGLRVIATTSSEGKVDALKAAGADHVIATADGVFHKIVRDLTDGLGADAVIEIAGRPTFDSSIRSLSIGGRLVAVGNVQPGPVQLNLAMPILKEVDVVGSGQALLSDLRRVVDLVRRKLIIPKIIETLPARDAARAHEILATSGAFGRVVLTHE